MTSQTAVYFVKGKQQANAKITLRKQLMKSQQNFFEQPVSPQVLQQQETDIIEQEIANDLHRQYTIESEDTFIKDEHLFNTFFYAEVDHLTRMQRESKLISNDVQKTINQITHDIEYQLRKNSDQVLRSKEMHANFILNSQSQQLLGILKQNQEKSLAKDKSLMLRTIDQTHISPFLTARNTHVIKGQLIDQKQGSLPVLIRNDTAKNLTINTLIKRNQSRQNLTKPQSPFETASSRTSRNHNEYENNLLGNSMMKGTSGSIGIFKSKDDEINKYLVNLLKEGEEGQDNGLIKPLNRYKILNFRETAINYEILLEMKFLKIKVIIRKLQENIEKLRRQNHYISEDLIREQEKLKDLEQQYQKIDKKQISTNNSKGSILLSPMKTFTPNHQQTYQLKFQNEQGKEAVYRRQEELEIEFQKNFTQIDDLEYQFQQYKSISKGIREDQYNHYCRLLQCGLDFRNDGLTWIIRSIWHIGRDIDPQTLPKFLDIDANSYLFETAKLEMKVWTLGLELKSLRYADILQKQRRKTLMSRQDLMPNARFSNIADWNKLNQETNISNLKARFKNKDELISQIREKLRQSKQTRKQTLKIAVGPETHNQKDQKEIDKFFFSLLEGNQLLGGGSWVSPNDFQSSKDANVNSIISGGGKYAGMGIMEKLRNFARTTIDRVKMKTKLEEQIQSLKLEIKSKRQKEFLRFYKLYYSKPVNAQSYEQKFSVEFDTIILALFGEKRIRKFQQQVFQENVNKQTYLLAKQQ